MGKEQSHTLVTEKKKERKKDAKSERKSTESITYAHTRIRDLGRRRPPLIRVKIDFFPLP